MENTTAKSLFNFSEALVQIKTGLRMTRRGWNGKGQYVACTAGPSGGMSLPFLFIRTVQGDSVPWLASQTDLLADDWEVYKDESEGGM